MGSLNVTVMGSLDQTFVAPGAGVRATTVGGVRSVATQLPDSHARPLPHAVPSGLLVPALHVAGDVGDAHVVLPTRQGLAGTSHAWLATHAAMHEPLAQTSPAPHAVPSAFAAASVHVPGVVDDAQVIAPLRHGFAG
jgi:hypothetical protein